CACLTQGNSAQLLKFLKDERNQICNPKELLHSLLELVDDTDPGAISETILTLTPHLQTVVLRLDEGKAASVGLVLSALQRQLSRLPVPYTRQQEEADEYGLCRCCAALAAFTNPFTESLKRENGNCVNTAEDEELRAELLKFCMRSLREPLLDAELRGDRKSPLWLFATEIMVTLPTIQEPFSELLFFNSLKKSPLMDISQSKESRACLAYLLFVQLINIESFPAVFSPVFVLQCNMEYINEMLSSKKESHLRKGLALYEKSLEGVQDNSLPVSLLELRSFYSVPQVKRHQREKGLQVFQLFINKLDAEAKHKFFRCMLKTSNHPGIEGYIVKNIRNEVESSMKPDNGNKWFLGAEFVSLLGLALCLPQGPETDLVHNMDKIMESLNLLRYLLLKEKELRSIADVWEELCRIKDEYLKMLRVCISISRGYYSAELKALREDQKIKAKAARLVQKITVKHENASDMSPEAQQQVLQSALVTFDLMESLIVRIEEITEENLKILN
uniref:Glomulin, FKBP associated protein b n=1 Tax=Sphaeramia orbicularis TaxID=375764 RepID=A0A672ZXV3_9TELE